MPVTDLLDLMTLYARAGIADWQTADHGLRNRARVFLGNAIADNEPEASVTIQTVFNDANANRLRFIPMPRRPKKGNPERCFFRPIRRIVGGRTIANFELFLVVSAQNCLAFRFEPSHGAASTHSYGHVQMTRMLLGKTVAVPHMLTWFPDSYPAFPLSTSDPLRMFLAMAAAVHGYLPGVVGVFQDMFQKASRPGEAQLYIAELASVLGRAP